MILSPPLCYDTPFHLLTGVCELEDAERLLPVFASSAMEVFPFQVAAANFALKAQYLKGAVLCDEGALGKTFEALMLIAQAGAGSVRDTLSIADMCLSYCGEKVTYAGVLEVLGESDPHSIITLANDILSGNLSLALEKVAKIVDLGKSIQTLSSSLAETFRNMMFVKKCSTANKFLGLPQDIFESLDKVQRNYQTDTLLNAMKKFTALEGEFRYSSQHRILLEAAIVEVGLFENGETEKKTIIAQKQPVRSLQAANTVKAEENTRPSKESEAENIDVKAVPNASVNQTPSTNENGKITVSMTDDLAKKANQIWGFVLAKWIEWEATAF